TQKSTRGRPLPPPMPRPSSEKGGSMSLPFPVALNKSRSLGSSPPQAMCHPCARLEAVAHEEFHRSAPDPGGALVQEARGKKVAAHTGHAVFAAAQIRVIEGIERFHSQQKRLALVNLELALNGHSPILASRVIEGVPANGAVLS